MRGKYKKKKKSSSEFRKAENMEAEAGLRDELEELTQGGAKEIIEDEDEGDEGYDRESHVVDTVREAENMEAESGMMDELEELAQSGSAEVIEDEDEGDEGYDRESLIVRTVREAENMEAESGMMDELEGLAQGGLAEIIEDEDETKEGYDRESHVVDTVREAENMEAESGMMDELEELAQSGSAEVIEDEDEGDEGYDRESLIVDTVRKAENMEAEVGVREELEELARNGPDILMETEQDERFDEAAAIREIQEVLTEMTGKTPIMPSGEQMDGDEENFTSYTEAKKILEQNHLRRLFSDDNTDTLWQYVNGYYNPLCRPELESMAYENLPEKIKMKKDKVRPLLNGIVDYMLLESSRKDAKTECFTQADLEVVRNHIVFKNGVYDVVTGELEPHTDQYPYYVGVDAYFLGDNYKESTAYKMLKRNATENDKESMDMIDCVTAALFLNTKHKNIFAAGSASNSGKSKYFEFIEHLLPEKRISRLEPSRLDGRFALGGSDAVVLFCCADIEMDYVSRKAASSLKMITGDTFIRTEAKYQNAKETRIMGNVLLGTNGRLRTKVRDPGFAERLRVLPFIRSVPKEKRDEQLLVKLLEDRDEIMTECAQRLHENVRNGQMRIPESELSVQMKQEWLYPSNLFDEFLENKIVITGDRNDILDRTTIYQCYADYYAIHCGEVESGDAEILKKKEFFDKLKEASQGKVFDRRVKPEDKSKKNYVHRLGGIRLRTETV